MALVKCVECGNQVSDRAKNCPHCGCPVEPEVKTIRCPECGHNVQEESMVCENCGCPMESEVENHEFAEHELNIPEESEVPSIPAIEPAKKPTKSKKKIVWICIAAAIALMAIILIGSIASAGKNDPIVGSWEIDSYVEDGDAESASGVDCHVKINKNGTGVFYLEGESGSLTWDYREKDDELLIYDGTLDGEYISYGIVDNIASSQHGNLYIAIEPDFIMIFEKK